MSSSCEPSPTTAPAAHHADEVRLAHRGDALAYDDRGEGCIAVSGAGSIARPADARPRTQGMAQRRIGLEVEGGGGVVQNEHRRISHERPRNGEALSLAAGEILARRLDGCVEPLGVGAYEISRLSHLERPPQRIVACLGVAPPQVGADGAGDKTRLLRDDADDPTELCERPGAHIVTE